MCSDRLVAVLAFEELSITAYGHQDGLWSLKCGARRLGESWGAVAKESYVRLNRDELADIAEAWISAKLHLATLGQLSFLDDRQEPTGDSGTF